MERKYYYFVTSLKDVSIEMPKIPFSLQSFVEEASIHLVPADRRCLNALLYRFDNENLIKLLNKKDTFNSLGHFSKAELQEQIFFPSKLPSYMKTFLSRVKNEEREYPQYSYEDTLNILYYRYLKSISNRFIRDYVLFDLEMKNVLTAFNCQKYALPPENNILLLNEDSQKLIQNNRTPGFGLLHDIAWLQDVLNISQISVPSERERKLDVFRFNIANRIWENEDFNINSILAYFVMLSIIDRWTPLTAEIGTPVFNGITDELSSDKTVFPEQQISPTGV